MFGVLDVSKIHETPPTETSKFWIQTGEQTVVFIVEQSGTGNVAYLYHSLQIGGNVDRALSIQPAIRVTHVPEAAVK